MPPPSTIVVLMLDSRRYGVPLAAVERIMRVVDCQPLPGAPRVVAGVINVHGAVLPVINLRARFHLPERPPLLTDQLVLVRGARRRLALWVDETCGLETITPDDWISANEIVPAIDLVSGVVKHADGLILIHDLDACLGLDEQHALDVALAAPPA